MRFYFQRLLLLLLLLSACSYRASSPSGGKNREEIRQELTDAFIKNRSQSNNKWPSQMSLENSGQSAVKYTFNKNLTEVTDTLLKRYKPDGAAVFAMNPETGEVLVYRNYEKGVAQPRDLVASTSFPAASLFKIITAADAIHTSHLELDSPITFNGQNWTLYKRDVFAKKNRWTRKVTVKEAFAKSLNTAFARLAIDFGSLDGLKELTKDWGFNEYFDTDLLFEPSTVEVPKFKNYELAEIASGFNKKTKMSPIHAGMVISSIVNGGELLKPYVVKSLANQKNEVYYHGKTEVVRELSIDDGLLSKLQSLMKQTVSRGTSRKAFRRFLRKKKHKNIQVGGKSGHIYSRSLKGDIDWFAGYALKGNQKVVVVVALVNKEYWRVKSSYLAQRLFTYHFL